MIAAGLPHGHHGRGNLSACQISIRWFLDQIEAIVAAEETMRARRACRRMRRGLLRLKKMGFSDAPAGAADRAQTEPTIARGARKTGRHAGLQAHRYLRRRIPVAHALSCIRAMKADGDRAQCSRPTDREKMIILGGGPNRIGQGIEFDYCCVHAAYALSRRGFETIMVNCNPETVSHRLRHLRPALFRAVDRRRRDRPDPPANRATARCWASSCSSAGRRR